MYYNEFFTPPGLVEKMISHIPDHFWTPQTKWLEPTCGDGEFMLAVFQKLFHHPSYQEYEEEKRIQHIHNNLYMVDLNPKNIEKTKQRFTCSHIFCADFLSWNPEIKFDVILGNPPFQKPSSSYLNGALRKGGKKIYEKIIDRALTFLRPEGHLCFICPLNLWSGTNFLYKKIVSHYSVKYIFLNNLKKRWFPKVGQNLKMCYFVISNENPGKTIVETFSGTYEIELKNINPVEDWTPDNVKLLETYLTHKTKGFIRTNDKNRFFQQVENGYKLIQNPDRIFFVLPKEELLKNSYYGVEKYILFRMKPFDEGLYDKGELLLSSQIYFLPLTNYSTEEKGNIISFFKSDDYKKIVKLTTTSQFLKGGIIDYLNIEKIRRGNL